MRGLKIYWSKKIGPFRVTVSRRGVRLSFKVL